MEDLSGKQWPNVKAAAGSDHFAVLPQEVMDGFSDKATTDEATEMIGLPVNPQNRIDALKAALKPKEDK